MVGLKLFLLLATFFTITECPSSSICTEIRDKEQQCTLGGEKIPASYTFALPTIWWGQNNFHLAISQILISYRYQVMLIHSLLPSPSTNTPFQVAELVNLAPPILVVIFLCILRTRLIKCKKIGIFHPKSSYLSVMYIADISLKDLKW